MIKIGLTGGPATGKSSVLKIFKSLGFPCLSSDSVVHALYKKGSPLARRIASAFGKAYLKKDGSVNRPKLRSKVLSDKRMRERLEKIVHPEVRRIRAKETKRFKESGESLAVFEVPLLFEASLAEEFDRIIVVSSKRDVQFERLIKHRSMAKREAIALMGSQFALRTKCRRADYVITNDGSLAALKTKVKQFIEKITPCLRT